MYALPSQRVFLYGDGWFIDPGHEGIGQFLNVLPAYSYPTFRRPAARALPASAPVYHRPFYPLPFFTGLCLHPSLESCAL